MKRIIRITRQLMALFLVLVASSMMFLSSPAVAATSSVFLDDQNFDTEVLTSDLPVIVDFGATWCGPCKALEPIIQGIATDYQGKVKVYKLDIDDAPEVTRKYGVRSVPTIVSFKNGEKNAQIAGLTTRDNILKNTGF